MTVIVKRSRTRQPVAYTGADYSTGLTNGLIEATLVTSSGFVTSGGLRQTAVGATALSGVPSASGWSRKTPGTSFTSQYESAPLPLMSGTPTAFTLYARLKVFNVSCDTATSWATSRTIYGVQFTSTSGIAFAPNVSEALMGVFAVGVGRYTSGITLSFDKEYDCFMTHPGGTSAGTLTVIGVGSASTTTFALTAATDPKVIIGHAVSTGSSGSGSVIVGAAWTRALSDLEMRQVAVNPWQLFMPRRITIPVSVAGGGAVPSITAVYADSVGTDRATPRVTLDYA